MTGYGAARGEAAGWALRLRLRSVNHRFLDPQLRLPPELDSALPLLERDLRAALRRGRVELSGAFERAPAAPVRVNRPVAAAYLAAVRELEDEEGGLRFTGLTAGDLLRLPGVVGGEKSGGGDPAESALTRLAREVLSRCLADHHAMRAREGAALVADILAHLAAVERAAADIAARRRSLEADLAARLRERVARLAGVHQPGAMSAPSLSPERLAVEVALLAERSDIGEELTRLASHAAQLRRLLAAGGEVGKKLDFLLQEMNREVNTLMAKTSGLAGDGLAVTDLGLSVKAALEKIREQAQNLE